jgi:hypothetical protein
MRLTVAALAVLMLGLSAPPATANTYDVWGCRSPDNRPAPAAGWQRFPLPEPRVGDDCARLQGLQTSLPGFAVRAGTAFGWAFTAPPGTTIASYELYRSALVGLGMDGTVRHYALYHDQLQFDTRYLGEACVPIGSPCTSVGDPAASDPMDPDNRVARDQLSLTRLILVVECLRPNAAGECGDANPAGSLRIGRSRIALSDDVAPTLEPPSGALVARGAALEGAQAVSVAASDVGGGVARFEVLVDGETVAQETLAGDHPGCRTPYVDVVPCPSNTARSFAFDTNAVADGKHVLQIAAFDAAGNRMLSSPVQVRVGNRATANGRGASRSARLVARFERGGRRTTVGYRRTRALHGRLTGPDRRPIANARIEVMASNARPGARTRREGVIETRDDGRFRYVPLRGPSRRLQLRYHAFTLDPEPSASATMKFSVRAGVRLNVRPRRASSRGTVRFHGRLAGGPGRAGVQVTLYAVARRGRNRVPVAVLRTDDAGRFRFRYRFVRTFAPFTYRFQAHLERQRDYPYASSSSRKVTVRIVR